MMTHMGTMADSDGNFGPVEEAKRKCPKCAGPMTCRSWESSCGGYEDYKYTCKDPKCGHELWVDGIDS